MYKIYFDHKPLFLTSEITPSIEEYLHHEETVLIDDFDAHAVRAMIHEMEAPQISTGVFLHNDIEEVLQAFKKKLVLVQAAGGLVYTPDHEILLIHRRGKWDLPKGKLDPGEDLVTCAEREVKEETGLNEIKNESSLIVTYHTYHERGKHILKESHWYLFSSSKQEVMLPQIEEDIDQCKWVLISELASYMENTHASIIDVVNAGINQLKERGNI